MKRQKVAARSSDTKTTHSRLASLNPATSILTEDEKKFPELCTVRPLQLQPQFAHSKRVHVVATLFMPVGSQIPFDLDGRSGFYQR